MKREWMSTAFPMDIMPCPPWIVIMCNNSTELCQSDILPDHIHDELMPCAFMTDTLSIDFRCIEVSAENLIDAVFKLDFQQQGSEYFANVFAYSDPSSSSATNYRVGLFALGSAKPSRGCAKLSRKNAGCTVGFF